jgi:predicted RNA-binding protein associated with RNAse of E/G family
MTLRPPRPVRIHYLRPPDRHTVYDQVLVHDDGRVKVTFAAHLDLESPLVIDGDRALEAGSDAVWFTFPGAWHDIGRFHRADGTFTGIYANVITPCVFEPGGVWRTTDLFLDVWLPARPGGGFGPPRLVDVDELGRAEAEGHLGPDLARRARKEARTLLEAAREGSWPPEVVHRWTRERARGRL